MIIDFFNNYSPEEQDRLIEILERYYVYEYHHSVDGVLYEKYSDAPYWGVGKCEKGKCESCKYGDPDEPYYGASDCDEYDDAEYNKWFDNIITSNELEEINNLKFQHSRQIMLFDEDDEWWSLPSDITIELLTWFNKKNITYCLIKGLTTQSDVLYVKRFIPNPEYRLRFGEPSVHDMKYAVDELGWKCYNTIDLTNIRNHGQVREWVMENKTGIIHKWDSGALLFENEIDAMAAKLRWLE